MMERGMSFSPSSQQDAEIRADFDHLVDQLTTDDSPSIDNIPDRNHTSSAPPILELESNSLFAFQPTFEYSQIFSDIRSDESYSDFYRQYANPASLPPPLDARPLLYDENYGYGGSVGEAGTPVASSQQDIIYGMDQMRIKGHAEDPGVIRQPVSPEIPVPVQAHQVPTFQTVHQPSPRIQYAHPAFTIRDKANQPGSLLQVNEARAPHQNGDGAVAPASVPKTRQVNALPEICRHFLSGYCHRGDRCQFLHVLPTAATSVSISTSVTDAHAAPAPESAGSGTGANGTGPAAAVTLPPMSRVLAPGAERKVVDASAHGGFAFGVPPQDHALRAQPVAQATPSGSHHHHSQRGGRGQSGGTRQFAEAAPREGTHSPPEEGDESPSVSQRGDFKYTTVQQLQGSIFQVCKDHQRGCRFLQRKLEDRDASDIEMIFNEVYEHIVDLMVDPFGNYFAQRLLEYGTREQRMAIVQKAAPDVVRISVNVHGTRVVQKMVDLLSAPDEVRFLVSILRNSVVPLIKDLNGNHVIQRCLQKLSAEDNQFLFDSAVEHSLEIAMHKHGCCVLQRCIDHATVGQRDMLVEEIVRQSLKLVEDAYGNYVVQYILDLNSPEYTERLVYSLKGHIGRLSVQKFSSNVVEKCLKIGRPYLRAFIIHELVDHPSFAGLLHDPFANYVIQTALTVAEKKEFLLMVDRIKPNLPVLRGTPHGKRIQHKMQRQF